MIHLPPRTRIYLGFAASLVAALSFWWPAFTRLVATGRGDWQYFHHMWEVGLHSLLRYGELPLWDPFHCGGITLWANPQAQIYAPLFLISFVLGTTVALKLFVVFHAAAGFGGMYLYARREVELSTVSSAASALLWAGSGFFASQLSNGHVAFAPFWLTPFLLLAWRAAMRDIRWSVGVAGLVALSVWEGGIYPVSFAVLLLAFDSVVALCREPARWAKLVSAGLISAVLSGLLSAPRLIPVMSEFGRSPRHTRLADQLDLGHIITMFTAREHPWKVDGHPFNWSEYGAFIGWGVLGLALVGAGLVLWKRRSKWPLLVGAAGFTALMCGNLGPWSPWALLHHLPLFGSLRVPSRFSVYVLFFLVLLAGVALDQLRSLPRGRWGQIALALVLVMDVYLGTHWSIDRWPSFPIYQGQAHARFHQSEAPYNYLAHFPAMGVGTTSCHVEPMPVRVSPEIRTGDQPQVRVGSGAVLASGRTANTVFAEVELRAPGAVVFNQNWHPHWVANIGRVVPEQDILTVALPAGRHRVQVDYRPPLKGPLLLGLTGLLFALVVLFSGRIRRAFARVGTPG